ASVLRNSQLQHLATLARTVDDDVRWGNAEVEREPQLEVRNDLRPCAELVQCDDCRGKRVGLVGIADVDLRIVLSECVSKSLEVGTQTIEVDNLQRRAE